MRFQIDDQLHGHPKVRRAGAAAVGVWATAGSWSMAYKTDGFVPAWWVVDQWGKAGKTAAARLVTVGLWEPTERGGEPGYRFHDWADYQPNSTQIEKKRIDSRERQRKLRERRQPAPGSGPHDGDVTHLSRVK